MRGGADLLLCPALERLRSSFGAIKTAGLATNTFNLDFTIFFILDHILFFLQLLAKQEKYQRHVRVAADG